MGHVLGHLCIVCISVGTDMCTDICIDMGIDMSTDMCIDMCIDMSVCVLQLLPCRTPQPPFATLVYRHVCGYVYRHECRHVHQYVFRNVCKVCMDIFTSV